MVVKTSLLLQSVSLRPQAEQFDPPIIVRLLVKAYPHLFFQCFKPNFINEICNVFKRLSNSFEVSRVIAIQIHKVSYNRVVNSSHNILCECGVLSDTVCLFSSSKGSEKFSKVIPHTSHTGYSFEAVIFI